MVKDARLGVGLIGDTARIGRGAVAGQPKHIDLFSHDRFGLTVQLRRHFVNVDECLFGHGQRCGDVLDRHVGRRGLKPQLACRGTLGASRSAGRVGIPGAEPDRVPFGVDHRHAAQQRVVADIRVVKDEAGFPHFGIPARGAGEQGVEAERLTRIGVHVFEPLAIDQRADLTTDHASRPMLSTCSAMRSPMPSQLAAGAALTGWATGHDIVDGPRDR